MRINKHHRSYLVGAQLIGAPPIMNFYKQVRQSLVGAQLIGAPPIYRPNGLPMPYPSR